MANARKYGYIKQVKKDRPVGWQKPGKPLPGRKRQEDDRNAKAMGKQLRV